MSEYLCGDLEHLKYCLSRSYYSALFKLPTLVTYAAASIRVKQIVPRHGRVKTHSCRVTAASIRLCCVTLTPRQCRVKPAHQHFSS
ncbi:hypothetical protein CY34DRAFT_812068 [Suillus luteus UH-Slu-Lm8-n1]|uniref:Uncharacterized protein n=1 Tax=Suillus luteus UH-Slu-Lm8-n1 TaxID=930992 RepID=A0A0D0AMU6_9AGAM|nr:hypothetical protein CY34DRAFT_812068 [Suillus luteus UH-Slu-Lm8-n1]